MATLLGLGAMPVINENDTVATDEIRFGDNDRLGARVAEMITADTLVLLSDIDGLYTGDPRSDASATFIPEIREITPEIEAMAGVAGVRDVERRHGDQADGRAASRMAAGCRMAIADGAYRRRAGRADRRHRALHLVPARGRASVGAQEVDRRLAQAGRHAGRRRRRGARAARPARACCRPASLRSPANSARGDVVDVKDRGGRVLARGLVAYAADDARRIAGRKSAEIERLLGFRGRDEIVHRDDLVVE